MIYNNKWIKQNKYRFLIKIIFYADSQVSPTSWTGPDFLKAVILKLSAPSFN